MINLAPAELPKQAASFDLPMSLGLLADTGQMASDRFEEYAVVGERAPDGSTRPTKGALSMAIAVARNLDLRGLVVPTASARRETMTMASFTKFAPAIFVVVGIASIAWWGIPTAKVKELGSVELEGNDVPYHYPAFVGNTLYVSFVDAGGLDLRIVQIDIKTGDHREISGAELDGPGKPKGSPFD